MREIRNEQARLSWTNDNIVWSVKCVLRKKDCTFLKKFWKGLNLGSLFRGPRRGEGSQQLPWTFSVTVTKTETFINS